MLLAVQDLDGKYYLISLDTLAVMWPRVTLGEEYGKCKLASRLNVGKSRQIMVGNVPIGGDAPICRSSMTIQKQRDLSLPLLIRLQRLQKVGDLVRRIHSDHGCCQKRLVAIRKLVDHSLIAAYFISDV